MYRLLVDVPSLFRVDDLSFVLACLLLASVADWVGHSLHNATWYFPLHLVHFSVNLQVVLLHAVKAPALLLCFLLHVRALCCRTPVSDFSTEGTLMVAAGQECWCSELVSCWRSGASLLWL